MFRNTSHEGRLSDARSSSSPSPLGVTAAGLDSQESSWIGLLSVVSRPAFSFLQKYLPGGAPRPPGPSDGAARWIGVGLQRTFVDEDRDFLTQLDHVMSLTPHEDPHLSYLQCQRDGSAGLLEPGDGSTLPWLSADSLREIGLASAEEVDLKLCRRSQVGYFSSARTFISHVLLSATSSQAMKPQGDKDWRPQAESSKGGTWWGSFWGGEHASQREPPSSVSWAEEGTEADLLRPQQPETKGLAAETTDVFVQSCGRESATLGENTGPGEHKEEPVNNGGLHTVQNTEGFTPEPRIGLSSSEAAAACSEVALLTPDQDNGYSSLEEEHFQMCRLVRTPSDEQQQEAEPTEICVPVIAEMEEESSEERVSASVNVDEDEPRPSELQEGVSAEATELSTPQCQNKAIAFIMGCPCSDDDSSQSDGESSDDDDDGFDSEGTSDMSDSTDEDDDEASDSDEEAISEADRLWNSLCQNLDPYNPQNFSAQLHTASTPPRTIPTATPPSSAQSTPASSPAASPPSSSSSPPSGSDTWDDSTSASEVDEAESLHLLSSFSFSSDPYSPFNFQAQLRTRGPVKAAARAKKTPQTPPHSPRHKEASPPVYRKEEAEERLDSGFSEPSSSSSSSSSSSVQRCGSTKKVRFCDHVEEFFASCGEEEEEEDRRGPWEELARDRSRFLRRCLEVEQSIAYCLQPQHRSLVYVRLAVLHVQDV
ncbi:protein phosphatase 1 regulatory subunit 15B-like [Scophthalmus maximus]|uniref:protein phosphatase 1 regulatory subunit 15B-like n=1 Tax=Scophthalmus maximus TaxID=52904 RepID=UPI001FA87ADA|nr:protein phosphatase 1 regulatory subunit 15B-like [Scophthalmus maximus]